MKLVKNSDITLTADGNGAPIFFEPVRSQQTVLCNGGHKRSDLRTFKVLHTDFFRAAFPLNHVVVVINRPIEMKMCFITKPKVIKPARSLLKLFIRPVAHLDSLLFVLLLRHMVRWNSKRNSFKSFLMTLKNVVGDITSSWARIW